MSTEAITTTAPDYDAGYAAGIAGRPLPAECGYSAGEAVYLQRDDAAPIRRPDRGEVFVRVAIHAIRMMDRGEDPQAFFSGAHQAMCAAAVSAYDTEALYIWSNMDCAHPESRDDLLRTVDSMARMHRIPIDWEAELLSPPKAN